MSEDSRIELFMEQLVYLALFTQRCSCPRPVLYLVIQSKSLSLSLPRPVKCYLVLCALLYGSLSSRLE